MRKVWLISALAIFMAVFAGGNAAIAAPTYVVNPGDSLWSIANTHNTSVNAIKQLNGLTSDTLHIGQVLTLSESVVSAVAPAVAPTGDYVIQVGDNLWTIAQKFGTTVENIKALNGLTGEALYAGDTLIISGTPSQAVSRSGNRTTGSRVIAKAAEYLGTPSKYGGSGPGGFDCSGFAQYIYKQFGISLNRSAAAQYSNGVAVNRANLVAGDLVFFNCNGSGISHVGIYCEDGKFIHSSSPRSGGVIYSKLSESYYAGSYVGARRVIR